MKTYLLIISSLIFLSCSHKLSNGHYKGTELISVDSYNNYWPGASEQRTNTDSLKRQWYHEVNIYIFNSFILIKKIPFYIKDGIKKFSWEGGTYYYNADVSYNSKDKDFLMSGSLIVCKSCPKTGTATPLYTYPFYDIRRHKNYWVVKTTHEKNLIFKKQRK